MPVIFRKKAAPVQSIAAEPTPEPEALKPPLKSHAEAPDHPPIMAMATHPAPAPDAAPPKKAPTPPWEAPQETLLAALARYALGGAPTLMVVHKTNGRSWEVKGFDPKTGRAALKQADLKHLLTPLLREKDNANYYPLWRD